MSAVTPTLCGTRREVLQAGEPVVLTRQVRRGARASRLENGAPGHVVGYSAQEPWADVRVGEATVRLRGEDVTALRLGYARHVYSA